jgi:hypothetical protein
VLGMVEGSLSSRGITQLQFFPLFHCPEKLFAYFHKTKFYISFFSTIVRYSDVPPLLQA